MLLLLESWNVGGPLRRPWCVLEAAKCPFADTGFVRWSRAQILEMILAPQQINLFTFTPAFTLPGAGFLHNAAPLDSVGWRGDFPWTL